MISSRKDLTEPLPSSTLTAPLSPGSSQGPLEMWQDIFAAVMRRDFSAMSRELARSPAAAASVLDNEGNKLLHLCLASLPEEHLLAATKMLFERGARADIINCAGETPLHVLFGRDIAVAAKVAVAWQLTAQGAKINKRTAAHVTAVDYALRCRPPYHPTPGMICELAKMGCDLSRTGANGLTPLMQAIRYHPRAALALVYALLDAPVREPQLAARAQQESLDGQGRLIGTPLLAVAFFAEGAERDEMAAVLLDRGASLSHAYANYTNLARLAQLHPHGRMRRAQEVQEVISSWIENVRQGLWRASDTMDRRNFGAPAAPSALPTAVPAPTTQPAMQPPHPSTTVPSTRRLADTLRGVGKQLAALQLVDVNEAEADPIDDSSKFCDACRRGDVDAVVAMLAAYPTLLLAAGRPHFAKTRLFRNNAAEQDPSERASGPLPLGLAAQHRRRQRVFDHLLAFRQEQLQAPSQHRIVGIYGMLDARDDEGMTALMWAVESGNHHAMQTLLKAGADDTLAVPKQHVSNLRGTVDKPTAIHLGIAQKQPYAVRLLLNCKEQRAEAIDYAGYLRCAAQLGTAAVAVTRAIEQHRQDEHKRNALVLSAAQSEQQPLRSALRHQPKSRRTAHVHFAANEEK